MYVSMYVLDPRGGWGRKRKCKKCRTIIKSKKGQQGESFRKREFQKEREKEREREKKREKKREREKRNTYSTSSDAAAWLHCIY